jgi:acyl carrier protein
MSGGLIDSFSLVHIAVFIELNFGVVIPDDELTVENFDTLTQIAARVAAG